MNTKVLLAGLAAAVVAFLLGWLIYGIILMDFMAANTTTYDGLVKENMNLLLIFVSNLVMGVLLAWIISKWDGVMSVVNAACISAIIGLGFALGIDLMFLAGYNLINGIAVVADVIAYVVMYAAMGAVIGLILKPKKN